MELTQSFSLPYSAEQVWAAFDDLEAIVRCLPGAALLDAPTDGQLKISMTVKLGPIVAAFAGDGAMALDNSTLSGSISGAGSDRKSGSRVKGQANFSLTEDTTIVQSPVTTVHISVQYTISGALAQFSRGGIMNDVAQRLTQAFSENLKSKLEAAQKPAMADQGPTSASTTASTPASASTKPKSKNSTAPLDLGMLFWAALWERIKRALRH
jgi:carbon monoxide dehydrogenase subunit G